MELALDAAVENRVRAVSIDECLVHGWPGALLNSGPVAERAESSSTVNTEDINANWGNILVLPMRCNFLS